MMRPNAASPGGRPRGRLAPLPDLGDIPRPPTGHGFGGGYEWMEEGLPEGWHVEPMWGRDGWNLGSWPYVVVALYIDSEYELRSHHLCRRRHQRQAL